MSSTENSLVPELSVTNFEKSLDFYTRVLGFSIHHQRTEEGFAFLTLGDTQLMIDQIGKGRTWQTGEFEYPLGRGINFQIVVKSIETLLNTIQQEGIALFLDLEEKWYKVNDHEEGNRQFVVQDPDGYLLRFTQDLGSR